MTCPNTGTISANTIIKIIANVNTIDNALVLIKERVSVTSYARLKAFITAFTPFEANHSIDNKPNDNKPPFCSFTTLSTFTSIKDIASSGTYGSNKLSTLSV
ncbi:Uncharacterised protein [Streptococcus pneumoniae]|nr:Uncharacterised protein [Streptococcus pneumoniae]